MHYVYEHTVDNTSHTVRYTGVLPADRLFTWADIGRFPPSQNILMHSVIYRTEILRACGLRLPKHTFYVTTSLSICRCALQKAVLYGPRPLPLLHRPRGPERQREGHGQACDQQLRVTKLMITAVDLYRLPPEQKKLRAYMFNYLSMMMTISSVFLTMDGTPEALQKKKELWQFPSCTTAASTSAACSRLRGPATCPAKAAAP